MSGAHVIVTGTVTQGIRIMREVYNGATGSDVIAVCPRDGVRAVTGLRVGSYNVLPEAHLLATHSEEYRDLLHEMISELEVGMLKTNPR